MRSVHCHFGTVARDFVRVREVVGIRGSLVTTFYGIDVSKVFEEYPADYYDRLRDACELYFVMSEDMKRRVVAKGFPSEQVRAHPVSIDVASYPYRVRELLEDEPLRLRSSAASWRRRAPTTCCGRSVRRAAHPPGRCAARSSGAVSSMRSCARFTRSLGLGETASFEGYLAVEEMIRLFENQHVLVQPSKTAANGDME